ASLTSFILTSSAMVPAELSALSLHDALPICFAQYPQRAFAADGDGQPFRLMHAIDEDFPAGDDIVIAPHAVAHDGSFVQQVEPTAEGSDAFHLRQGRLRKESMFPLQLDGQRLVVLFGLL